LNFSINAAPPSHQEIVDRRTSVKNKLRNLQLFYIITLYVIPLFAIIGCFLLHGVQTYTTKNYMIAEIVMMVIAAVGQGLKIQGIAVSVIGVVLAGLTLYMLPLAAIMIPCGIILQNKPKQLQGKLNNLGQVPSSRERNIVEMRTVSKPVSAYYDKVKATKRTYFVRGEYHAMIAAREAEIQEHNKKRTSVSNEE